MGVRVGFDNIINKCEVKQQWTHRNNSDIIKNIEFMNIKDSKRWTPVCVANNYRIKQLNICNRAWCEIFWGTVAILGGQISLLITMPRAHIEVIHVASVKIQFIVGSSRGLFYMYRLIPFNLSSLEHRRELFRSLNVKIV